MNTASFRFDGSTVVITGAAKGIGAACARKLAHAGATVLLWDTDDDAGNALAQALTDLGLRAGYRHCDVSSHAQVQAAVAQATQQFGPLHGLVNNAGIFKAADFFDISEADWHAVIGVNLNGAFFVGQAIARAMAATGGGAIVNMGSVNGVVAIPGIASYNASKGGVHQLTRVMALSLADRGIRVNAVAPGTIATELARNAVLVDEAAHARVMSRTPLKRLGEPDEVADAVMFLLSDAASYMTGEIVYVDGGRLSLNYTV